MSTIDEAKKLVKSIGATDPAMELPRNNEYIVRAGGPGISTEVVTPPISGKYHTLYVRDRLRDEVGHIGVSFIVEPANK